MTSKEKETLLSLLCEIREIARTGKRVGRLVAENIVDRIDQKTETAIELLYIIPVEDEKK